MITHIQVIYYKAWGVFVFILFLLFLVSCGDRDKKVVIGVLISGEGRWTLATIPSHPWWLT